MRIQRISLNFAGYSDPNFLNKATHILTNLTGNAFYPTLTPTLIELKAAIDDYSLALQAAGNGDRNDVAIKVAARSALELMLVTLGNCVMMVAKGDVAMLQSSGFTLTKTPEPRKLGVLGSVTLLKGVNSGELVAKVKALYGADKYVHQLALSLPGDDTVWQDFPGNPSKFVFTGLVPGKQYWVRVIALGSRGQKSYSTIATAFVM